MIKDLGIEYRTAKLKITLKMAGRYVGDIDESTLNGMGIDYKVLAKPYGISVSARWTKNDSQESAEYFVPYENVNYLLK